MRRGLERALVLIATWTMVAAAAPRSQPVSPGHPDRFAGVAGPCPTFSWTWAPGSAGFELAVFALPEEPDPRGWTAEDLAALEPVLREALPATTAWTPDVERCLERGGRYAWFVRVLDPVAEDEKEGRRGAGDIAERIDAVEPLAPGELVEVDPDRPGWFRRSRGARSPRVVGVVSGQPAITLNNADLGGPLGEVGSDQRPLLALAGKVPVRVSDEGGAIAPGDLLVASSIPGVAMRCERLRRCRGASVGKALEPHRAGEGRILMMVFPN